ncbi:hypothetical protein PAAG_12140 [Paracoccidioides lutzii Pb01]|uniref:Uncharacterized protein n=1 Tax=Paracoccidioides lutzii (strain ATCC MYA-826 / Pb01) TaxID=502779 RepID=A0A0A2V511_PARBA|nr:hypothetical protein PAAG_12140 [Paracoccidioides lutzii Pb01]KGQ01195.1 hypothetical protein PAAG_12140 [Paracoccidioides lutzii Pb01]
MSKDIISEYVRYTFIHAGDDTDIPSAHMDVPTWHVVNETSLSRITYDDLEQESQAQNGELGNWGILDGSWRGRQEMALFGRRLFSTEPTPAVLPC